MSYIPDCRTDEYYNQKYLNEKDAEFVRGFDWCTEMAADNLFDNLTDFFPEDSYFGHILCEELPVSMQEEYEWQVSFGAEGENPPPEKRVVKTYADLLRMQLIDWIESERDQLITSMIDGMEEEEYQTIKQKVDDKK